MGGLYAAYGDLVMKLCLWGMAAIATGVAFAVIVRKAKRYAKTLRRVGFVAALLLGTFIYGMIREGAVTQEDKDDYRDAMAPIMEERAEMARNLLPSDDDDFARRNDSSKSGNGLNALTKESDENADSSRPDRNLRDATQGIADSDYEAGIVLAEVRTNEVHDFTAPPNAIWNQDWLDFGGFADNFRLEFDGLTFPFGTNSISALTVFQRGLMRPRTVVASSFIAPMQARLGAVPSFRHSLLPEANRPSGFWHCFTPSNSVVMTWRNFLLGRDALRPVTLQAELFEDGCAEFRYDLSQAGAETITNIVAGIRCNSLGTTLDSLDANVTTIRWQRLNPEDVANPDPDGDGISTCDEIFVYRTDPYNADTDYDGLSDYDEINVYNSDPNNPRSVNPLYCDAFALLLGDEDPFAYPEGSTNTIYEHIIYTGTTNAPFAYPVPTDEIGVLKIMVSGSGAGRLVVGDAVVPLLGSQTGLTRLTGLRGGANPDNPVNPVTNTLLLVVGKGVRKTLWWEKPDGLDVAIDSDDLLIGELPTLLRLKGWIAFPHTKATVPCIHDLEAKGKVLSLVHGEEFSGLTALWQCASPSVVITNFPPVSADVHASFSTRGTTEISYTVDHPDRLNASAPSFGQTLEFCPKLAPEEEASLFGSPEENLSTNMCHCVEPQGIVCGCCAYGLCNCPNPECPCYENPFIAPDETSEEDAEDEYDAITALPEALNVLQLHGSVATQNVVHLDVPDEYRKCCSCPGHQTNHVALAYRSRRLSVTDAAGDDFSVSNLDCNVVVRGREPSIAPFDDAVLFSTNGASYLSRKYTVLGAKIDTYYEAPIGLYNSINPAFGYPATASTNIDVAATLRLIADVGLSNGVVRVAIENATCDAKVWVPAHSEPVLQNGEYEWVDHPCEVLVGPGIGERFMTIRQWRRIVSLAGSNGELNALLTSAATGRCDLVFSYATEHGGQAIKTSARQRVTFVNPPLVADYDRDGSVGTNDVADAAAMRPVYFWVSEGDWNGDNAFVDEVGFWGRLLNGASDYKCANDDKVNGRCDVINLLPLSMSETSIFSQWNPNEVEYRVGGDVDAIRDAGYCILDLSDCEFSDIPLGDVPDVDGTPENVAELSRFGEQLVLPVSAVDGSRRCAIAIEFPQRVDDCLLYFTAKHKATSQLLYSFGVPLRIGNARNMISWVNLRSAAGGSGGLPARMDTPDWPAEEHDDGAVVFVHGYNMEEDVETPLWAENVFKKLWWSGLDRGFVAVQWNGDRGQVFGTLTPNYYGNVQNAFQTAPALSNAMETVQGPKWFLAHSLGNMLVSAAIQDYGMQHEKYFMLNAAIALEAFDPVAGITPESHDCMTPRSWTNYVDRVRATHWFERFPEGDGRRLLTWKGRFSNVTNVVNFYSTQEEVVNNGDGDWHTIARRNYVWYNQETRKGLWPMMLHEYEGGWEFNPDYDTVTGSWLGDEYVENRFHMLPADAADLTDAQLQQTPFFLDFYNPEMHTSPNGMIVASNYLCRAEMLAYAIPAESFAVGANPIPWLNAYTNIVTNENIPSRNFNMAFFIAGQDDLPENDATDTKKKHRDWQHSTFVQRSYKRVHQLYKEIIKHIKEAHYE